ncbi:MAG: hypothetical protein U1E02_26785, partial [Hydrogenophaga sp.]|nr:hypothetical protein [Hydrogenophaga sp.]
MNKKKYIYLVALTAIAWLSTFCRAEINTVGELQATLKKETWSGQDCTDVQAALTKFKTNPWVKAQSKTLTDRLEKCSSKTAPTPPAGSQEEIRKLMAKIAEQQKTIEALQADIKRFGKTPVAVPRLQQPLTQSANQAQIEEARKYIDDQQATIDLLKAEQETPQKIAETVGESATAAEEEQIKETEPSDPMLRELLKRRKKVETSEEEGFESPQYQATTLKSNIDLLKKQIGEERAPSPTQMARPGKEKEEKETLFSFKQKCDDGEFKFTDEKLDELEGLLVLMMDKPIFKIDYIPHSAPQQQTAK